MREVQDHYFREAKREGYLSRAAYKLIEIDERRKVLRPGDRVLDCGAAPGSWLQVAAGRVGPKGFVVGVDLQPIRRSIGHGNVKSIEGDLTTIEAAVLVAAIGARGKAAGGPGPGVGGFDVVLSDMAPSTSGEHSADHFRSVRLCEAVLDRCPDVLRRGGKLVMKVLEGESYPALMRRVQTMFESAKGFKPKASRSESTEMYIVAEGFKGEVAAATDAAQAESLLPKRKPSAGWGSQQRQ